MAMGTAVGTITPTLGSIAVSEREESTPPGEDADLERDIRADRKFSLSEAIGRMAGSGLMKGASPVTGKRQTELAIEDYLRRRLTDAGGVLGSVLLRHVRASDLLLHGHDRPLAVVADYLRQVLGSAYLLEELVREADVEWGRALGHRPHFQQAGRPPHPEDPYTVESVRIALSQLVEKLSTGDT
jgi:hypothetical protein